MINGRLLDSLVDTGSKTVRLLHISDLHLGKYRSINQLDHERKLLCLHDDDALGALREVIEELQGYIDGILVTGDIAVTGTSADLGIAFELVTPPRGHRRVMPLLGGRERRRSIFGTLSKPIILLPGNHDRFCNISGWPGNRFYDVFSLFWREGAGGVQIDFIPHNSPVLAVICADFSLRSVFHCIFSIRGFWLSLVHILRNLPKPNRWLNMVFEVVGWHWGQGRVYNKVLRILRDKTSQVHSEHPDCGIIWAIHFSPRSGINPNLLLVNSQKLVREAEKLGVKYILCGHLHRSETYLSDYDVTVQCTGTATCLGGDAETVIHLREITVEDGDIKIRSRPFDYIKRLNSYHPRT
jgi:hypothetical protein